jgi:hypothetical protein
MESMVWTTKDLSLRELYKKKNQTELVDRNSHKIPYKNRVFHMGETRLPSSPKGTVNQAESVKSDSSETGFYFLH